MRLGLHRVARYAALAVSLLASASTALAQGAWPHRPLQVIVAYPAGGLADVMGRSLAQLLAQNTGQQVVVENRGGANGNLAADIVAKSPADGHTLCLCSTVIESVNPFLFRRMSYDPQKDLMPVASTGRVQVFLVTRPGLAPTSLNEFVELARTSRNPLTFGSAGAGSTPHLVAELFKRAAKFEATHVPYKGAAPAMQDLLGGQFDFFFDPGLSFPHVREGKLRMLGVASAQRSPLFPNVPTLRELGYQGLDFDTWFGLYAPAATPPEVVRRINEEVAKALTNEALRQRFRDLGAEAVAMSPAAFKAVAERERAVFGRLIKDNAISAD
jgi:tripartite-type tricarboxylate transporter receptor subunit TctC